VLASYLLRQAKVVLQDKAASTACPQEVNRGRHTEELIHTADRQRAVLAETISMDLHKVDPEAVVDMAQTNSAIKTDMGEADLLAAIHTPASNRPAAHRDKEATEG
jgi:hypothetical protein